MLDDGVANQFRSDAKDAGQFIPDGADFFHDHARADPVHTPAAPLLGMTAAHQVATARLPEKFLRKLDHILVHIQNQPARNPFDELPHLVPQYNLLFCQ